MDTEAFDKFVRSQQDASPESAHIDWDQQRSEWLAYLDQLYAKIESFLDKYTSSGQIKVEHQTIELDEDHLGAYPAKQMVLKIGRQIVKLVPVGTLLIGSKGRVDVIGPVGRTQLVLVDSKAAGPADLFHVGKRRPHTGPRKPPKDVEWEWRIGPRPPERIFQALTQDAFLDLIVEVTVNG